MPNIAFFCMNQKGFSVLKAFLLEFGCESIAYVVSSRDTSIHKDYYDEIKKLANDFSLTFYDRKSLGQPKKSEKYKLAIGWRWLIPDFDNLIVLHDSILPKYRGFSPLVCMLICGEKELGVTALRASSDYDTGDIIDQLTVEIDYPISIQNAISTVIPLYIELVKRIYIMISEEQLKYTKQIEEDSSYSLWLDEEDYFIDWQSWSAERIKRFIDAVGFPYDNAKTFINRRVYRVLKTQVWNDVYVHSRERHIGKVIFFVDKKPIVICASGLLLVDSVVDENNKHVDLNLRTRFK